MTNLELPDGSNEHGSDITSSVEEKLAKEGVAVISPDSLLGRIGKISKRVAVPAASGLTLLLATALPSDSDVGVSEIFPEPTASPEAPITQVENTGEILSSKTDTGQKKDTEDLRRSIEEEFGIKLHTFDEISLIPVIKVRHGVKNLFSSNQDLDGAKFKSFRSGTCAFAQRFVQPKRGWRKSTYNFRARGSLRLGQAESYAELSAPDYAPL